ncbi:MAG: hypothetical protein QNJ91_03830 [Gammaproteobacteria bacterium]|nr:hypothetical protein [Gammaproteobacteria bacterium]
MTIKDIAIMAAILAGIYANLTFQDSLAADPAVVDGYLVQLHEPSAALREREARGRVTIYDQLSVADVDRALDQQFERIGSMMFVRTQYPQPDGSIAGDDDCD